MSTPADGSVEEHRKSNSNSSEASVVGFHWEWVGWRICDSWLADWRLNSMTVQNGKLKRRRMVLFIIPKPNRLLLRASFCLSADDLLALPPFVLVGRSPQHNNKQTIAKAFEQCTEKASFRSMYVRVREIARRGGQVVE